MNIILAKSAGFCFGVKRAVETVYKEAEKIRHRSIPLDRSSIMKRLLQILKKRCAGHPFDR